MALFGLVFAVFAFSIAGLAIGVIFRRAPLKGTCAGGTCPKALRCSACQQQKTEAEHS